MLLVAAALGAAAPAAMPAAASRQPAAPAAALIPTPAQALPDLRILDVEVSPAPARDGAELTVVLTLHNASTAVAAGDIAIEVIHDRMLLQPVPIHRTLIYLPADELAEVSFTLPRVAMDASPYTVYAMVDVSNAIEEADETNNTAWRRVEVCGDPGDGETADGHDNDCDGLVDEGLGLESGADEALAMLRAQQRQAARDAAQLVYATATLPRGFERRRTVRLASEEGMLVKPPDPPAPVARGGSGGGEAGGRGAAGAGRGRRPTGPPVGNVDATGSVDDPRAALRLTDWNGADLESGDRISLQDADGHFLIADVLRDGRIETRIETRGLERLFTIIKMEAEAAGDAVVRPGDHVALVAANGRFVHAEGGGGGPLRANRAEAAGWETFTITFEPAGEDR